MFVWRRRCCVKCGNRMSTHENFVEDGKTYRTKVREKKPKPEPKPKAKPVVKEEPQPVRNVRKEIEKLKEYWDYQKNIGEDPFE